MKFVSPVPAGDEVEVEVAGDSGARAAPEVQPGVEAVRGVLGAKRLLEARGDVHQLAPLVPASAPGACAR